MSRRITVLFLAALAASFGADDEPSLPTFTDVTEKSGVDFLNHNSPTSKKYLIESMVGGVAMLDYNGDGHLDLFFTNGAEVTDPMPADTLPDKFDARYWDRLYRNNGDGTFTDTTEEAGVKGTNYAQGVAVADYAARRHIRS